VPGLIKHACPGVHQPMDEADGGLARVRVPGGRLSLDQWAAVARAAARHGSGTIELTSRANVQLRGIDRRHGPDLVDDLVAAGLVHPDGDADQRRNVIGAPAAGLDPTEVLDVRPVVDELVDRLVADHVAMPPKAGVLVDGGGAISVRGRVADVALGAVRVAGTAEAMFEVRLAEALPRARVTESAPVVSVADAPRLAVRLLDDHRRVADRLHDDGAAVLLGDDVDRVPGASLERSTPAAVAAPLGTRTAVDGRPLVGMAPVLGRLGAEVAADLASALGDAGASDVRLTPWRGLLAAVDDVTVVTRLAGLGLIVDSADPAAGVVACAGRTGCASGTVDTVADGHLVVAALRARGAGPAPTVHLSGCDKRCASHAPHDLTLVGDDGTYDGFDRAEVVRFRRRSTADALDELERVGLGR
jgi:precorrin-3B synthase